MKKIAFILVLLLPLLASSCKYDDIDSLIGTRWENEDKSIILDFQTSDRCEVTYKKLNQTADYTYYYEIPNISLMIPLSSGFSNYMGTVKGRKMNLKGLYSDGDGIDFKRKK